LISHFFHVNSIAMRLHKIHFLLCLSILFFTETLSAQQLLTFPAIPDRTPSDKYTCRVRQVGSNVWQDAFVLQTISKLRTTPSNGYTTNLFNWTASWIAFEFSGTPVEVEISKVGGAAITKAMVRPVGHASAATIIGGKVYVTFQNPANINVDIDGQMEDRYTGMNYTGAPVHTISLFANPVFKKPDLTNPRVYQLEPGQTIPLSSSTTWDTLVFKPGIHRIGTPYQIASRKVLYIPGDAVVHGTIHPPDLWGASAAINWSVYGSGTLSGEEIDWNTSVSTNKSFTRQAAGVRLEGFVVADPAHHTFNMNSTNQTDDNFVNIYKNLKILGWRINGDGGNGFVNSIVTDCFYRTQDDVFYYGGNKMKISNCVTWNDYNGAVVYVTKGANTLEESYFKDIKVIYHRAGWHYWEGGRVISFRDRTPGNVIRNVQIRNVLIEDPFPAFPPFYCKMTNAGNSSALYDYDNIIIENVRQDAVSVTRSGDANFGRPRNTMLGLDDTRRFANITFKNCYYNGKGLGSFADGDFLTNAFTQNITFILDAVLPLNLLSFSGYSKDNKAFLNWQTTNEKDANHFDIERSLDGVSFMKVGQIKCLGSKLGFNKYAFTDATFTENTNFYYRLKQVNNDNTFNYSTIIVLEANNHKSKSIVIYPNPAHETINVEGKNGVQIYNSVGQLVKEIKQAITQIDISDLPNGVYLLKTDKQVGQFIKTK
jgi:Secretion system C-terminal sorting domain